MKGKFPINVVKGTPPGRAGQPDDIGQVAVFLVSDESCWINKQAILAAGGLTI